MTRAIRWTDEWVQALEHLRISLIVSGDFRRS